jgi:hypothetical protein
MQPCRLILNALHGKRWLGFGMDIIVGEGDSAVAASFFFRA